jgi:hypothetical protein
VMRTANVMTAFHVTSTNVSERPVGTDRTSQSRIVVRWIPPRLVLTDNRDTSTSHVTTRTHVPRTSVMDLPSRARSHLIPIRNAVIHLTNVKTVIRERSTNA